MLLLMANEAEPFFFIQLADPQFGMFASFSGMADEAIADYARRGMRIRREPAFEGLDRERALFERAIAEVNRLRPAFVVVCGDMIHDCGSDEQAREVLRIADKLDREIALYWIPGNHDVCPDAVAPTDKYLAWYRSHFGPDRHAFQHAGASFIAIDSCVLDHPEHLPGEPEAQLAFLEAELEAARASGSEQIVVLAHHPLFLESPDEADSYWTVAPERRRPVLRLLREYGASTFLAGHMHRNHYASDGRLQVVASGPVGYPLGDDPSGYRIVRVHGERLDHDYYAFGHGPDTVEL